MVCAPAWVYLALRKAGQRPDSVDAGDMGAGFT